MVTPTDLREARLKVNSPPRKSRGIKSLAVLVVLIWGTSQGWSWWKDHETAQGLKGKVQADDILMLTTATCPYCEAARRWMDKHGVSYRECDVETDPACRAQFEVRGSPGVPLLKVKGRWQLGFDPQSLMLALEQPATPSAASPGSQAQL